MNDPRSLAGTNPNPAADARLLADLQAARDHTAASVERLGDAFEGLRADIRAMLTAPEDVIDPSTAPVVRLGQGEYTRDTMPGDLLRQAATHATKGRAVARLDALKREFADAEIAYELSDLPPDDNQNEVLLDRCGDARCAMLSAAKALAKGGVK